MRKIELTLSPNYVPNWTFVQAVRELLQNAYDQERIDPTKEATCEYKPSEEALIISNKNTVLTENTLLLGQSTKANDKTTIGQFGEGYKIATLVLLREGKRVTFYNYGAKEIWRPRFVKSRRFGTDVLTFFIEKIPALSKVPRKDLVITVEGISQDEYEHHIVPTDLYLRNDYTIIETTKIGDIIDLSGKVFVGGLFVCDYKPYKYGYNFKPEYIELDRDRKLISDFELRWKASEMWSLSEQTDCVMTMIMSGCADVAYLFSIGWHYRWADLAAEKFYKKYGHNAVPVTNQYELEALPEGYKGVVVNEIFAELIKASDEYNKPDTSACTPKQQLLIWFNGIRDMLSTSNIEAFETIYSQLP